MVNGSVSVVGAVYGALVWHEEVFSNAIRRMTGFLLRWCHKDAPRRPYGGSIYINVATWEFTWQSPEFRRPVAAI
jgi:hypothetical protein